MASIDASLKRLGTDYLDIYFCHRYDADTPLEEVVFAMSDLIARGKVLYWGTSEWSGAQIAEAVQFAKANGLRPPVTEQPQYSMVYRERVENEILPVTERHGVGLVVFSPLGMGLLTGKYDEGKPEGARLTRESGFAKRLLTEENIQKARDLKAVADDLGVTRAALALAWVLRQPGVSSAIVGATSPEQMTMNLGAADFRLEPAAVGRIEAILNPKAEG